MKKLLPLILVTPVLLSGCIASTVVDIVTLPVEVAAKGVDMATTSQSEADENRGRAIREREEQIGKLSRRRDKAMDRCEDGNRDACREAQKLNEQLEALIDNP